MADPVTLGVLGAVALTEGIKFLYTQAGSILDRRAERRKAQQEATAEPLVIESGGLLEQDAASVVENAQKVDELAVEISSLKQALGAFADDVEVPDARDAETMAKVYALRAALEAVTGKELTFKGEQREGKGVAKLHGEVNADTIRGIASGIDTDRVEGEMRGKVNVRVVEEKANVAGVRVRK